MFGRKGQDQVLSSPAEPPLGRVSRSRSSQAIEAAFRETADPASYVSREATERVLEGLSSCLLTSGRPAALSAIPGMGKSVLLHVLAERLAARRRFVFLPYGSLSLFDLCSWVLGIMREPTSGDPLQAVLAIASRQREQGSALVLLIDDASGMELQTARELRALWTVAKGGLQLVLSSPDDARGDRVFAGLGSQVQTIRLSDPMTIEETRDFVHRRLRQAGVPKVAQNRFDRACIEWIHAQSGGVPRLVQRLGQCILVEQPADVTPSWHHNHDWLGAPLDELTPFDES